MSIVRFISVNHNLKSNKIFVRAKEKKRKRDKTAEPRKEERFTNARAFAESAPVALCHNCTHPHVFYVPANVSLYPRPFPHALPLRHLTISDDLVPGALPTITYVT